MKDQINAGLLAFYADNLESGGFDREAFCSLELEGLELKARVQAVADALWAQLQPFPDGVERLLGCLGSEGDFVDWPVAQFIETYGLEDLEVSVDAMHRLTPHFTCEFAVRPFLERYPDRMLAVMQQWAGDSNEHVRRLASEGMRPRLPWGRQLRAYIADPAPVMSVLERLHGDSAEYVRRSVANCLNDVSKDHPEVALEAAERWGNAWIANRALRGLVKAGDPRALAVLGFGPTQTEVHGLTLDAAAYTLGDTMEICFTLVNPGPVARVMVDYRVHYQKANGSLSAKVFKLKQLELKTSERVQIVRRQHLKPISTRRYHAGLHAVDVQVNGVPQGRVEFELSLP